MSLYEMLTEAGFKGLLIPEKFWDKMAHKYFWLRKFHTPTYISSNKWLINEKVEVYFDDFHVDVFKVGNDKPTMTFGKRDQNEVIFKYIQDLEASIKNKSE